MEHMENATERTAMNQDVFTGKWKQMRGTLKSWWGKLTDDDFERIGGQKDKLLGMLQEKYGYTRDLAQREIDRHFKEYTEGAGQTMKDTAQDLYQGAAKTYDDMKTKAQELGSAASEQAKNATAAVGEKMGSLASTIRQNAPQEGTVGSAATAVADNLEAAGSYLRDSNFEGMINDLTALIRRYPMQSLLVGLGIGYLWTRRSER
jgi:uncharacterized protein YjbJ (UPF0337 family)